MVDWLEKRENKELTLENIEMILKKLEYKYCLIETGITEENKKEIENPCYKKICWQNQKSQIKVCEVMKNNKIPEHFAYIKFYKQNDTDEEKALSVGKTNRNDPDFEFAQFTIEGANNQKNKMETKKYRKLPGDLAKMWLYEKKATWVYENILIFWKPVSEGANVSLMAVQAEADIGGLLGLFNS